MSHSSKKDDFLAPAPKRLDIVALNRDSKSTDIKPKRNEVILEEEEHIKNLEKIITRDYFPTLHAISNLEKSEAGDLSTNLSVKRGSVSEEEIEFLTLNQYTAKYNSEDNASFEKLLDNDKKKWNEKFWWIAKQEEDAKSKLLAIQASSQNKLNNMVQEGILSYRQIEGSRENLLQITDYEAKNNFMFAPSAKGTSTITYSDPDSIDHKGIDYSNTRITTLQLATSDLKQHLSERDSAHEKMKFRMQTPDLLGMGISKNSNALKKNEFSLLSMPSPSPGNESPMMTWGNVEGTPIVLSRPTSFQIQHSSLKDELANQLSLNILRKKKVSQMNQKEKMKDMLTPGHRKASDLRQATPNMSSKSKSIKKEKVTISTPSSYKQEVTKSVIKSNNLIPQKDLTKNLLDI